MNLFRALLLQILVLATAAAPLLGWSPPGSVSAAEHSRTRGEQPDGAARAARWAWPLSPRPQLLRPFRPPPQRWLSGHRGVDLSAAPGAAVLSPAPGTVAFAGTVAGRGVVVIDHGEGIRSAFEPLQPLVEAGAHVERGQEIGRISGSSHCGADCLHWGVRAAGEYTDPLAFLGLDSRPSALLPLS